MSTTSNTRSWMAIQTQSHEISDRPIRFAIASDIEALANLMDESYRGTIDHEGETLEQCAEEMRDTLSGKYGLYISEASFLAEVDNVAMSACLITRWKEKPLVAFTMTNPNLQRKGLSRALLEKSVDALAKMGEPVLYLVVTDANTAAKNLYRKMGFKELGRAYGKQPPPKLENCVETDRLLLEPICEGHASEMCELFADRELHHFVPFEPPTLEEQQKRCARWAIGRSPDGLEIYLNWAGRDKQSGKVMGHFQGGIKNKGEASIGYVVAREFQGKGLAQEALQAVFDFLRDIYSIQFVKAWSDTRNTASLRLVERLGMKIVETIKDADFFKGSSSDEYVFAKSLESSTTIVLIGNPQVRSVLVRESGEPIVDLIKEFPTLKFDLERNNVQKQSESISLARKRVGQMLVEAQELLPKGYRLLIKECHRPMWVQKGFWDGYSAFLRKKFPEWSESQVYDECSKLNAPLDVAPHTTGGAVDLTLTDENGRLLDMGTEFNASPLETQMATYIEANNISAEAKKNRKVLSDSMIKAGFVNYPTEWWHWSYGDKYWAFMKKGAFAIFESKEVDGSNEEKKR